MFVSNSSRKVKQHNSSCPSLITRLQRRLEELSIQQENLEEIREQLLVDREAAALGRKAIRRQRLRAADTGIAYLDALRKHFSNLELPLPEDLLLAYDELEKHHIQLRHLEDENDRIEEDLGTAEWKFIDAEEELYQYRLTEVLSEELENEGIEENVFEMPEKRISNAVIHATPGAQHRAVSTEHDRLVKLWDSLRKQQTLRMETFIEPDSSPLRLEEDAQISLEATNLADDLLGLIADCEVKLQQLRPSLQVGATLEQRWGSSEPCTTRRKWYELDESGPHAKSEGAARQKADFLPPEHNIAHWSLKILKDSAVEKLRYLNYLRPRIKGKHFPEEGFEHWGSRITRSWTMEHMEEPEPIDPYVANDAFWSENEPNLEATPSVRREHDTSVPFADEVPSSRSATQPVVSLHADCFAACMITASSEGIELFWNDDEPPKTMLRSIEPSSPERPKTELTMTSTRLRETSGTGFQPTPTPDTGTSVHRNDDTVVVSRDDVGSIGEASREFTTGEGFFFVPFFARLVNNTFGHWHRTRDSEPHSFKIALSKDYLPVMFKNRLPAQQGTMTREDDLQILTEHKLKPEEVFSLHNGNVYDTTSSAHVRICNILDADLYDSSKLPENCFVVVQDEGNLKGFFTYPQSSSKRLLETSSPRTKVENQNKPCHRS